MLKALKEKSEWIVGIQVSKMRFLGKILPWWN